MIAKRQSNLSLYKLDIFIQIETASIDEGATISTIFILSSLTKYKSRFLLYEKSIFHAF